MLQQIINARDIAMSRTPQPTFNIIGSCADLFRFQADAGDLMRIMKGAFGIKPLCVLTSDTAVTDIENLGGAHVNLVIRREDELAAKHLRERFGTPYLAGRPYGINGTIRWLEEIAQISGLTANAAFLNAERVLAR